MYLTTAETILRYRISRSTLYRLLTDDASTFPRPLRIGGQMRFPIHQLEQWEESQIPKPEEATR